MTTVAVVGLGYVGLPLALAFGRRRPTIGYDESAERIEQCRVRSDPKGEVTAEEFAAAKEFRATSDPALLRDADFVLVAVPTSIDDDKAPDLSALVRACEVVGAHLKRGAVVVLESTVFPGATEEVCIPVLESASQGKWRRDFSVGYSPERVNPGDREHTVASVVKVVAGDSPETLERVAGLYESIVAAGVHRAPSIAVAEAAKVLENVQRDVNIALMNELATICERLGLDTLDVLAAASTKWNFLPFRPGLVGGSCIGVVPYYLAHRAERLGHRAELILAARKVNEGMGAYVASRVANAIASRGVPLRSATVNVLGMTFKEGCRDARNSRSSDIVRDLAGRGVSVHVHDPLADAAEVRREHGIDLATWDRLPRADVLVLAVAHEAYARAATDELAAKVRPGGTIFDVKGLLDRAAIEAAGLALERL